MKNSTSRSVQPLVVVADPDPLYQHHLIRFLGQDFRCIGTNTLRGTYQVILSEHPVLLILELNQPDGDSMSLIQQLQADVQLRMILIACVTHRATMIDKIRSFRAGADDYLVKPVPATFLGQMLLLKRAGHVARTGAMK